MKSDKTVSHLSGYDLQMINVLRKRLADMQLERVDPEVLENSYLYRFLFARDFNTHEAELMIKRHLEWLKINEPSTILCWNPPTLLSQEFQYEIIRRGRNPPVILIPLGFWDIKLACDTAGKDVFMSYVKQAFIRCYQALQDTSNNNTNDKSKLPQFTAVITLANLQVMRQLSCPQAWSAIMETLQIFEKNFPEVMFHGLVIDAPRLFNLLFNLIKPILSSHTLSKLRISSNSSEWMTELHQIVPPEHLPHRLGGSCISQIKIFNERPCVN